MSSRIAVIRTSDRGTFKTCRRRWAWSSHLQLNREPKQAQKPLWFGTGIHYALEDYFGLKEHASAAEAFDAYVRATVKQARQHMPDDWKEEAAMGMEMLHYFENLWIPGRDPYKTFIHQGVPQTEVNFIIDLPFDVKAHFPESPYDRAIYSGTIDRVIEDDNGILWLVDYKTAKIMKSSHFANDSQVTAYCWAASHVYQRPVAGLIYWQFLKQAPKVPEPLVSGKISTAANQRTTRGLYKQALINKYGAVAAAPLENRDFLDRLTMQEGPDQDAFIRRDKIYKNPASLQAEGVKILMELEDMLNPNLPLYPNANFMCPNMCPFYEPCLSMDDGSDWEQQLMDETQPRATQQESWRKYMQKNEITHVLNQTNPDGSKHYEALDFELSHTHDEGYRPSYSEQPSDTIDLSRRDFE